jgi:serine O-acetyltransferase
VILSLEFDDLMKYVYAQMNNLFPDGKGDNLLKYKSEFSLAIERLENCFKHIKNNNYCKDNQTYFNHLHSDQNTMFLWFLSNTIWKSNQDINICNKLFYMNKSLNGLSCMYNTELPDIFVLLHTVGTVLGNAKYSNYFVASQGCTVGAHHGVYPVVGQHVAMLPNSSIVGNCTIGNHVSLGINSTVYGKSIEDHTVVFVNGKGETEYKFKQDSWSNKWFV